MFEEVDRFWKVKVKLSQSWYPGCLNSAAASEQLATVICISYIVSPILIPFLNSDAQTATT